MLFAIIIFLMIILGLLIGALPVLLGLLIGICVNAYSVSHSKRIAPIWWNLICALVTLASAVMFYKDISDDSVEYGATPFLLLACFGIISMVLMAVSAIKNKKPKRNTKSRKKAEIKSASTPKITGNRNSHDKNSASTFVRPPEWEVKETWEDYPFPNYDIKHTYCKVVFDDSGKYFYYRTRNPEIKVGDKVCVPFGYKYERKIGRVIDMKEYKGSRAPYPLEKTKHIISKVELDTDNA